MSDLVGSLIVWMRPLVAPAAVAAAVPRDLPDQLVVIRRLGGTFDPPVIDQPTVGLEAWGPTQSAAHALIQEARGWVWSLRGGIVNGIPVYRIQEFAGPAWLPDPEHGNRPRYVATFSVSHREHLAVS